MREGNTTTKSRIRFTTAMTLLMFTSCPSVFSADAHSNGAAGAPGALSAINHGKRGQRSPGKPGQLPRNEVEMKAEHMTQMVELPYIPTYPGQATFVTGTRFPNAKGGESLTLRLRAAEHPEQVKDWYEVALKQYGWQMERVGCNERTTSAVRGNTTCQIVVSHPSRPGYRCDIIIHYRVFGS